MCDHDLVGAQNRKKRSDPGDHVAPLDLGQRHLTALKERIAPERDDQAHLSPRSSPPSVP